MKFIGKSNPAWTILGRPKENELKKTSVGPGLYNIKILNGKNEIKWTFPKEKKTVLLKKENKKIKNQKKEKEEKLILKYNDIYPVKNIGTFTTTNRNTFNKPNDIRLGPGSYDIINNNKLSFKKCGPNFGTKLENIFSENNKNIAGPGDYSPFTDNFIKGIKMKNRKCSSVKNRRIKYRKFKISDKTYNVSKKNKIFNSTFCKSIKLNKKEKDIPGPGFYNFGKYINLLKKKKKFSFGQKTSLKFDNQENIPASNFYNTMNNNFKKKNIGGKFSRSKRFKKEKRIQTDFDLKLDCKKKRNTGFTFFRSRKFNEKKDKIPGPGHYKLLSKNSKKGHTLNKQEKIFFKKSKIPGPCKYKITNKHKEKKNFKYSFNRANRFSLKNNENNSKQKKVKRLSFFNLNKTYDGPKTTMATSKRFKDDDPNNDIGPASYNIKSTIPHIQPWIVFDKNKLI